MLRFLAGTFFLILLPALAFAQPKGEVESVGFGSLYRPNCWIPMLVRVQAEKSGTYQIRVVQNDMDSDHEIFTETIPLTGSEDGKSTPQHFWVYFIPQPTEQGLHDTTRGGTLRDLQQELKVFLCDEKGRELTQLPITQTIQNVEGLQNGPFTVPRGVKVVLAVSDGTVQPIWRDYQQAIGDLEDVAFVPVRPVDLPEDVRGYEMVDAIVWLNANVPDPSKPSDEKRYNALQSYVRSGGHLVVCQPAQRDMTAPLADMLPVEVKEIVPKADLQPLYGIATAWREKITTAQREAMEKDPLARIQLQQDDWKFPQGPFMFARATPKPGAVVDLSIHWTPTDSTPYLARIGYGLGCVTWVAQDLSDPAITARAKSGWPYVWDRVLDYHNDLTVLDNYTPDKVKQVYASGSTMGIGHALLGAMELASKSRALVSIAVVFFLAYWMIAGPGIYLYLVSKSRSHLSWFLFAFSAVAATILTVLVVRLVVRGAPELAHISVVRGGVGEPDITFAHFGLYIPRDGEQEITLPDVQPKRVSYLTAFPEHPLQSTADAEFPAQLPYLIPISDDNDGSPVSITVPFRSTLKKFQARRVGATIGGPIAGTAQLRMTDFGNVIEGRVTNGTGYRLKNVYFVYYDEGEGRQDDQILYIPTWENGQTFDLNDFNDREVKRIGVEHETGNLFAIPEERVKIKGPMGKPGQDEGWSRYWYSGFRNGGFGNNALDDMGADVPRSFVMMSLFDRLPPMRNVDKENRAEVLRRGGRYLDMSSAVAAGRLLVLAQADASATLPIPLLVDREKVAGKGTLLYQYVLPLNHVSTPATTKPSSSQPTTAHAAASLKFTSPRVAVLR